MGLSHGTVAADSDGYGAYWGYRGPKLSSLRGDMEIKLFPTLVEELKIIISLRHTRSVIFYTQSSVIPDSISAIILLKIATGYEVPVV